jgi:hypothetical protein
MARTAVVLLACEASILLGCYLAGLYLAQRLFEDSTFSETFLMSHGILRLSFVVVTLMLGLYFHKLRENIRIGSLVELIQRVCLAVGIAFLVQAVIGYLLSGWIVPRNIMILGSAMVLIVIPPWRLLYFSLAPKA